MFSNILNSICPEYPFAVISSKDNQETYDDKVIKVKEENLPFESLSYEEQELGYPVNLENRVRVMANELAQLPYGGYGENEIDAFRKK